MMDIVKSASDLQQANISREIDVEVVKKSKEALKSQGEQIIQLIESSAVDPDLGQNVDLVA
jgi:hypothetical protein